MSEEKELPNGWSETTIGSVAMVNPKVDVSAISDSILVSFIPMAAVEAGTGQINTSAQRSFSEVKRGYTAFQNGDVLFAKITPCMENGKAAVARSLTSGIGFGSTEFHVLRPQEGIDTQLLYYYVSQESFRRTARSYMTGSAGQLRVPAIFLSNFSYPLPPLAEQNRIVSAIEQQFSRLDAGVAALQRAKSKLKRYRAAVLKAAVEGKLTENWRAEHPTTEPATQLLERILKERRAKWEADLRAKGKDPAKVKYIEPIAPEVESLPKLPEGWGWATLGQVADFQNGRPFPSREYNLEGAKLLRPGNLYADGTVKWTTSNTRYMPEVWAERNPDLIIRDHELVMNLTAQSLKDEFLGRVCITSEGERCLLNQRLARITTSEEFNALYALYMLKSAIFRRFVDGLNKGSLIQHMFTSQLVDFCFPLPSLIEQEQIVAEVERHLSLINQLVQPRGSSAGV